MTKQLTTQNATITTAAVEVRTLTITGKQVTLAVFRQLREEPLIADDGTLNGTPWGYVNYHPDKCADDRRKHWHFVWQQGQDLLRSRVDHELTRTSWGCDEGDAFFAAHAREVFEGRGRYFDGRLPAVDNDLTALLHREAPFPVTMTLDLGQAPAYFMWEEWRSAADKLAKSGDALAAPYEESRRRKLAQAVEGFSCALPEPGEVDELYTAYKQKLAREAERRQQHQQVRVGLAQLPQLFIAV
ncbi:hypothetical protein [Streptomyces sp. NPDC057199]|uniref:hypothetical protein n=1 Tax=Streptomyces sp. NPDC057199 TaxID=3346047 RepID=UPI003638EE00